MWFIRRIGIHYGICRSSQDLKTVTDMQCQECFSTKVKKIRRHNYKCTCNIQEQTYGSNELFQANSKEVFIISKKSYIIGLSVVSSFKNYGEIICFVVSWSANFKETRRGTSDTKNPNFYKIPNIGIYHELLKRYDVQEWIPVV